MTRIFSGWLDVTKRLQEDRYNNFPTKMEGKEYAEYLRTNFTAAVVELGEAMQEADWKPYKAEGRNPEKRDKFIEEIVDVLHHLGNILTLERVDDQELSDAYMRKVEKNRARSDHQATPSRDDGHDPNIPSGAYMVDEHVPWERVMERRAGY